MRRLVVLLTFVLALLAPGAAAQAAIDGRGTLQRLSPTSFGFVVRNTGDVNIGQFTWQTSVPGVYTNPRSRGAQCFPFELGVTCQGFVLRPGQTRRVSFDGPRSYPTGVPGFLLISEPEPGTEAAGPLPVTYQEGGGGGSAPVIGEQQRVQVVEGVVLVRERGTRRFIRLRGAQTIPDRSEIDTRRGTLRLTVAAENGTTQTAEVSEGRAIVDQNKAARPTTTLKLSEPLACPRRAAAARSKKRKLFIRTKGGRFKSRGRYAAGTASGTAWRTTDTCSVTRIDVTEGTVRVRDLRRRRTLQVTAPGSYTAHPSRR